MSVKENKAIVHRLVKEGWANLNILERVPMALTGRWAIGPRQGARSGQRTRTGKATERCSVASLQ